MPGRATERAETGKARIQLKATGGSWPSRKNVRFLQTVVVRTVLVLENLVCSGLGAEQAFGVCQPQQTLEVELWARQTWFPGKERAFHRRSAVKTSGYKLQGAWASV